MVDIFCKILNSNKEYIQATLMNADFKELSNITIKNNNYETINGCIFKFRGDWTNKNIFIPTKYKKVEDLFCRIVNSNEEYIEAILLDENFERINNFKIKNSNMTVSNGSIFKIRGDWIGKNLFRPLLYKEIEEGIIIPQKYVKTNDEVYFNSFDKDLKGIISVKNKDLRLKPFKKYYCISTIDKTEKGNFLNILFAKELSSYDLVTKKTIKVKNEIRLATAECSLLTKENNFLLEMDTNNYFKDSKYRVLGYWNDKTFKTVVANEIIEARIRIVRKIRHDEDTFHIYCKAEFLDYPISKKPPTNEVFIVGTFASIFKDDDFKVKGFWEKTKTSVRFRIIEHERVFGNDEKTITNFLRLSLRGSGVGKATITKMINEFKIDTLNVIEKDYLKLTKVKGINEDKALKIHERVMESKYLNDIMAYLVQNSIDNSAIIKIFKTFGIKTIEKIKENPYCITEIQGIPFETADLIAKNEGFKFDDKIRVKYGLLYLLKNESEQNGDLFTYKNKIFRNLYDFLRIKGSYLPDEVASISNSLITEVIEELITEKTIVKEISIENPELTCIYLSYNNYIENNIVKRLKEIMNNFKTPICSVSDIIGFIEDYEAKYKLKFAKKQKEAIQMALLNGVSILTGGPGTGKTHTINAIIKATKALKKGAVIDLCAPTGKASRRMSEMTNEEAMTIHRRLGYTPFENEDELNIIEGDLLVIDEASMIDADLFLKLLENVEEDTRILFVGDHNQIPSVGAGSVFRDLIESNELPITILDEIFRQAEDSKIIVNSHKIIKGITTDKGLDLSNSKDFKFYRHENQMDIQDRIINIISNKKEKGFNFNNVQILTLMNAGDLGTHELNYKIQRMFNLSTEEVQISPTKVFRLGDKVMQIKNNYDLNVFNGSVGEITKIFYEDDVNIEVDYDGDTVIYKGEECDELTLAYAMTVHKSQGSEFPIVIIPVHSSHVFMNNRNLIYTAITRAKSEVILVGSEKVLNEIILKIDNIKRNSQIIEKLKK